MKVVAVLIIESLSLLCMEFPTIIGDILLMLNDLFKKKAKSNSCVVGRTNKNHLAVVFDKPWVAVRFAVDVQHELNKIDWPPNFVNSRLLKPSFNGLLRGLRIKMGIALGPSDSLQLSTDTKDTFRGRICSNAHTLARLCLGGQILVSSDVYESSIESPDLSSTYWTVSECAKRQEGINAYIVSKTLHDEKDGVFHNTVMEKMGDTNMSSPFLVNAQEPSSGQNETHDVAKLNLEHCRSYFKEKYSSMTCLPLGVLGERRCALLGKASVVLQRVGLASKSLVVTESTEMMFERIRSLSHPNLLQILEVFEERNEIHVVWLHPRLRSIREIIDENEEEIEKLGGNQGVIRQILSGLGYLHSLDCAVFHPYLSTHTVLVDHAGVCRLIDYWPGAAPSLPVRHNDCAMIYWPPEILSGSVWCAGSVVYCLGFVVWELVTKRIPFRGHPMAKVMESVLQGGRPPLDGVADERTKEVIGLCWHHDAQTRPTLPDFHQAISELSGS